MARDITTEVSTVLSQSEMSPALFVKLEFESEDVFLWSGYHELDHAGDTWIGAGNIMSLSTIEETTEIKAVGARLTIAGLDQSFASIALSENYQNRPATIWLGMIDDDGTVVPDPFRIFSGRMDTMDITESAETATISISIENKLIDFERPRIRRYTDQDQKIDYPDDRGFEFVASIQETEIVWGRA